MGSYAPICYAYFNIISQHVQDTVIHLEVDEEQWRKITKGSKRQAMGMIPYDVRSTVSRYSSCSEHSTTIHAFRLATNEGVSSRPMNDIRVLYLKQTKIYFPQKNKVLQKKYSFEEAICRIFIEES